MNGFKMMADACRKMEERGLIDHKTAAKEIRIYEFLAECDADDIHTLADSSAFNDIIKAYMRAAMQAAGLDEDTRSDVMSQMRWILDERTSKEVLND